MTTYEEILNIIERQQDQCFTCCHYRRRQCGFVYDDKLIPDDRIPSGEEIENLSGDAYILFMTQLSGERCQKVDSEFDFLTSIENHLREVPPGVDEDTVNYVLQRAYRILNKYPAQSTLYTHTPIRNEIESAITLMMAYIDMDSIQNGASIYRLIQAADIGYDRPSGLFKVCPRQLAIGYMTHCVVQDHDGYYTSDGSFDATKWDITRKDYIGKSWLDVIAYYQHAEPDEPVVYVERNNRAPEQRPKPEITMPELKKLVDAGILSDELQLNPKQSRRSLIQYCVENQLFKPWHLENWRTIDGVILDRSKALITAESLKQAFQDYQKLNPIP